MSLIIRIAHLSHLRIKIILLLISSIEPKGKELANLERDLIKYYVFVLFMKLSDRF
jgi:hypothetical protein